MSKIIYQFISEAKGEFFHLVESCVYLKPLFIGFGLCVGFVNKSFAEEVIDFNENMTCKIIMARMFWIIGLVIFIKREEYLKSISIGFGVLPWMPTITIGVINA